MQLAKHKSKFSKPKVDIYCEAWFRLWRFFLISLMSVGMSRIVKLRRQKQDTSVRNVIKFLDLLENLRDISSPIQIQTIGNANVVGNLDVQIILQNI